MARVIFRVEGMEEIKRNIQRLGKVPQKHVTSSAKKGMNIAYKDSKANAPVDTGDLKRGIKLAPEKSKTKGKKVYRIVFDSTMNDVFQKKDASGKVIGYYPFSQEYGFFTKNGRYIPGYRFISEGLTNNTSNIERKIIDTMKSKIDDELRRAGWL